MKHLLAIFSLVLLVSNTAISAAPPTYVAPTKYSGTQRISRISVASDGAEANDGSGAAAVSADGRFIAFESLATNLVRGDTNGMADVFVHDRVTHETARVSVASDGTQAQGSSHYPSISADGHY